MQPSCFILNTSTVTQHQQSKRKDQLVNFVGCCSKQTTFPFTFSIMNSVKHTLKLLYQCCIYIEHLSLSVNLQAGMHHQAQLSLQE